MHPFRATCVLVTLLLLGATSWCQDSVLADIESDPSLIQFPFNPDSDGSGSVGIPDMLDFLMYFGNPIELFDSLNNGQVLNPYELSNVIATLAATIFQQQDMIEAMQSQLDALIPLSSLAPVAARSVFLVEDSTWVMSGLNVQLTNGMESTYGTPNGLGNLILGYNEEEGNHHLSSGSLAEGEIRIGSHNFILGVGHSYASNGNFIGGFNHSAWGQGSTLAGGQGSLSSGAFSSILGGLDNKATGLYSCISGGHSNTASGDRASVSGGLLNISGGIATSILGGQYMQIIEQYETASGQYDVND